MNAVLGELPTWNLSDLYSSPTGADLDTDLKRADQDAGSFARDYEGKVAGLDGKTLGAAVARFEALSDLLGRIGAYAQLYYAQDQADPKRGQFAQNVSEKLNDVGSKLLFFDLELKKIEDTDLAAKLKEPALAKYESWLRNVRLFRPHQLSDELEKYQYDQSVVGSSAWSRLFDETIARLRYPFRNEMLSESQILDKLSSKDAEVRKDAAKSFGKVQGDNIAVFSLVMNTLIKDKEIDDRWRKYKRPQSFRNLANVVEDEVVDALATSVKAAYPRLAHRYYKLKAKWFGVETMPYWDRNAPLPEHDDRTIPWTEAEKIVLDAYGAFSPELASVGAKFFGTGWIDAPARPGKSPGAFAHPTVPSAHPYLLLNYQGKVRDVMTLAHELGHGVHQVLSARQGALMADTPLTLAETASVFGEMLTFQSLLKSAPDQATRKAMLAGKVEDMLNTVVRQIAFYDFESRLHEERRKGELTPDAIGEIWLAVQSESLGPAFTFDDEYKHYWSYIGHFIHSPFYVYAYAFGDCLVNSLYAAYQSGLPGFQGKYLDMLKAGGVKRHKELLAPFGLDASDPAFWDKGLGVIAGFVDELETF
ncbi:MAG: M3 family oligoendopeptidase [Reyranella sp.]|uniref:M3 family oligoendopeptidase n=2 Tax=Bacteria TaxID=2 RepID=UPI001AC22A16|nr:M3 family oligoendopeptidase [Reyranella sp.]MBN9087597.1 M3 family oligoendopeptidase [Reyranella sp.]